MLINPLSLLLSLISFNKPCPTFLRCCVFPFTSKGTKATKEKCVQKHVMMYQYLLDHQILGLHVALCDAHMLPKKVTGVGKGYKTGRSGRRNFSSRKKATAGDGL